jgi:hypothetical protein
MSDAAGQPVSTSALVDVYLINWESGEIRFGDGLHGRRPPFGATIRLTHYGGAAMATSDQIN